MTRPVFSPYLCFGTPPFSGRTSVRLPTWWLAFGRVGLEYSSHPLGNIDMFQEVSPPFSHPELISARPVILLAGRMSILAKSLGHRDVGERPTIKLEHLRRLANFHKPGSKIEPDCGLIGGQSVQIEPLECGVRQRPLTFVRQ